MFKSARGPFKLQTKNKRQDGHPQISPNLTKSRAIRGSWTRFGFTVGVNGLLAGAASHCKSLVLSSTLTTIFHDHCLILFFIHYLSEMGSNILIVYGVCLCQISIFLALKFVIFNVADVCVFLHCC